MPWVTSVRRRRQWRESRLEDKSALNQHVANCTGRNRQHCRIDTGFYMRGVPFVRPRIVFNVDGISKVFVDLVARRFIKWFGITNGLAETRNYRETLKRQRGQNAG